MILTETICLQCKKAFTPSNKRNVYCSDGCKQDAYRDRKGIAKPNFLPTADKYHVFKSEEKILVYSKVHTRAYTDKEKDIEKLKKELNGIKKEVTANQNRIDSIINRNDSFFLKRATSILSGLVAIAAGWAIYALIKYLYKFKLTRIGLIIIGVPFVVLAVLIGFIVQKKDDKQHTEDLSNLSSFKAVLEDAVNRQKLKELEISREELILSTIPEFELLTEQQTKEVEEQIKLPKYGVPEIKSNDAKDTMSLYELQSKQFKTLKFDGEWSKLIGTPEQNFALMIYGQPGNGKSTFAVNLSEYLANNFGYVLYNSAEEGVSLSLQDKLKNINSDKLRVSSFKDFEGIKKHLKQSLSKFIVLDSVNHMNLTPDEVEELKKIDPTRGFITIHQVTKNGDYKGNNKFLHNCDIEIIVDEFVPIVKKNRYKIKP
jgi:tRNA uridine 5-carbamoylmethylation protein Kti12